MALSIFRVSSSPNAVVGALAFAFVATLPLRARCESLDELIQNIHANEELYRDIEVVVQFDYELLLTGSRRDPRLVERQSVISRTVFQREKLYFRTEENSHGVDGKNYHRIDLRGFDGNRTRLVSGRSVCNDVVGRMEDYREWRVHAALIRPWISGGTLSGTLAGAPSKFFHFRATSLADEILEGDECAKVRLDYWDPENDEMVADPSFVWIWISKKYNYIPVKIAGFGSAHSRDVPLEEGMHGDFREIATAVWFPFRLVKVAYDEIEVPKGRKVEKLRDVATVTKAELDPHYDDFLFRDIPFPDGMTVHEIKDGKVLNSYIAGYPETAHWTWPRGVILSATVLLTLAVAIVLVRRLRSRQLSTVGSR